jgi:Tol biopolymer transport system component
VNDQYEVFTMNSDGSGDKCMTCGKRELSNVRFRGQSAWSPDEKYIVFTGEASKYPRKGTGTTTRPGIGRNHNVWLMTADSSRFWQLTDYPENWGVIEPYFSHDGSMLSWGEEFMMEKYPNGKPQIDKHPGCYWGPQNLIFRKGEELCIWRIKYGKISYDNTGKPAISDLINVNPPENFTMIEPGGFTPDDKGFIYSYADLKDSPDGRGLWPDIFTTDLTGGNLKQLTKTPQIEEETAYSPDGKKIVVKRANKYPAADNNDELWIMDSDGNYLVQLTHFNDIGYPEYDPKSKQNAEHSWDPSGKAIYVGHVSDNGANGTELPGIIYKINFVGNCGNNK